MATQTTGGGSTTSFGNAPQAESDFFTDASTGLTEDTVAAPGDIVYLNVMANDLGGNAKSLFSVDNGTIGTSATVTTAPDTDLLSADGTYATAAAALGTGGTTDTSLNGARVWITSAGTIGYDASTLTAGFQAQLQALSAGETLTDSFTYAIRLGNGTLSWTTATVQFLGENDAPVLAADATGPHALQEIAGAKASPTPDATSATLTFTDLDLDDHHTVAVGAASAVWSGGSSLPAGLQTVLNGAVTHSLTDSTHIGSGSIGVAFSAADGNFDFLAAGETLTVTYNVTVSDGTAASSQPVTFTITGTNDTPTFGAVTTAPSGIAEAANTTASATPDTSSATFTFTDVDLNDHHTAVAGAASAFWSGGTTLPAGLQAALDGAVTTNVNDGAHTGSGSVSVNFSAADKTFDFLAQGETLQVTYNVTVSDGAASFVEPVTFTVTGTNDAPVLNPGVSAVHSVTGELAGVFGQSTPDTASTTLTFTDVDLNDHHTVGVSNATAVWSGGPGLPSGLQAVLDGAVTPSLTDSLHTGSGSIGVSFSAADSNFDFLAAGETLTVRYDVTVTDINSAASTRTVTFVVHGTNDAPVLSADPVVTHAFTEVAPSTSTPDTFSTTLAFADLDLTDTHTASPGTPTIAWGGTDAGTLSAGELTALHTALDSALQTNVTTDGPAGAVTAAFSAPDSTFDFLAAGQTLTVTYDVIVSDHNGGTSGVQPVTIMVTGTNDAPVLSADPVTTHTFTEVAPPSSTPDAFTTTLAFTDLDLTDTHTASPGTPSVAWGGTAAGTLSAGELTALHGMLDGALATTVTTDGPAGVVTAAFSAPDSTFDFLAAGQTLTVTYDVTVSDNNGGTSGVQPVTIVVTGTNDAPVLSADPVVTHTFTEVAPPTATPDAFSTTLAFADLDLTDTHTASPGTPAIAWGGTDHGALTVGQLTALHTALDGALATTVTTDGPAGVVTAAFSAPDNTFDFLAAGQTLTVTYDVTVSDHNGGTSSVQPVTIVVTGTNDAPVLSDDPVTTHAFTEIAPPTATPDTFSTTLAFTDLDLTDTHTASPGTPAIAWGGTDHGALTVGQLTALHTALDGALATTVTTDGPAGVVTAAFSAPDNTFDFLAAGQTLTVTYDVTVSDISGGTSGVQPVTIIVTGTNDAPVLSADPVATHTFTEVAPPTATPDAFSTTLAFADLDLTDTHTASPGTPAIAWGGTDHGALTVGQLTALHTALDGALATTVTTDGPAGVVTAAFSAPDNTFDFLAAGQTLTVTYDVTVSDHNGGTSSVQPVTIVVTGTNDAPVLSDDPVTTHAFTEIAPPTATPDTFSTTLAFTDLDLTDTHTASPGTPSVAWGGTAAGSLTTAQLTALHTALDGALATTVTTDGPAGVVTAAFSAPDNTFDFLAAGQTLTVTYDVTVSDHNGGTSSVQPVTIVVTGTNDAPVLSNVAASAAYTEQALPVTLSSGLVVTDVDNATQASAKVTISAGFQAGDTLMASTAGTGVTALWNSATHVLSLNGVDSVAHYQQVLDSVTFANATNDNPTNFGADPTRTLDWVVNDGSADSAHATTTINVTAVNDAPVVNADIGQLFFTEGQAPSTLDPFLTLSDVDSLNLVSAKIWISANFVSGQDVLAFVSQNGIAGSWDATAGVLTLTGSASVAAYQAAITSVTYANASQDPSGADRTISYQVDDGGGVNHASNIDASVVHVTPVDDAPALGGVAASAAYTEQAPAVTLSSGLTAADVDNTTLAGATVSITGGLQSGDTLAATATGAITVSYSGGVLTLSGADTLAHYQQVLDSVTFANASNDDPTNGGANPTRTIAWTVNDGSLDSATANTTINVTAVNNAPVNTVPTGVQSATLNAPLSIAGLSIADVDAGVGSLTTTLTVTHGTVSIGSVTGGAGVTSNGSASVTLNGTVAQINASLAALSYTGTSAGTDVLTVLTNDNGHTGATAQTDSDTVQISVTSPTPPTVTSVVASGPGITAGAGDLNAGHTVTLTVDMSEVVTVTGGTPTLALNDTGTATYQSGSGTNALVFTYTVAAGENTSDLTVTGSNLHGATIKNAANVSADLTGAVVNPTGVLIIDTTAPAAPTGLDLAAADDTGASSTDNITKNTTGLTISGSGETGAIVTLFDDVNNNGVQDSGEATLGTKTVTGGAFSTDIALTAGTHHVGAFQTDAAGNVSPGSARLDITVDTTPPSAPSVNTYHQGDHILTGSAEAGSTVIAVDQTGGGTVVGTGTADGSGHFNFALTAWSGNKTISVTATDIAGNTSSVTSLGSIKFPAGAAGSPINLDIHDGPGAGQPVAVTVGNLPAGWTLDGGAQNADGSWTVVTTDVSSLTVTTPSTYAGAETLDLTAAWTNADGTSSTLFVLDNVEAYAAGNPIFAWSGDDALTGSSGADTFIFSQPIGADVVHAFDVAQDTIDLIAYAGVSSFADVQAHLTSDAAGDAVLNLGDGQSITLLGVSASSLGTANFLFDQTPTVTNTGAMVIGDGAILPLSGTVANSGKISLGSSGDQTLVQLIQHGATLEGGGQVTLSDSSQNVISGSVATVLLDNVDNTISGAGQIGAGSLTLVNEGTIDATGSNALVIDTGSNTVVNSGLVEATASGGLTINSALDNSGTLVANGGDLHLMGAVTGSGGATIFGSSTIEFGAASSESVTFDAAASGTLKLDVAAAFTGMVSGFGGQDHLDLADVASTATVSYLVDADGLGGVLTVSDGSHTASIALAGQYDRAGFHVADDHFGGALIGYWLV